jgi:quercetin dioxygenase-like cupin family protein
LKKSIHIIRPEDVETYQPDLHANAVNRRLLRTGHLEIILGMIGRDGGAQEHVHEKNEQFIYMLQGKGRVQTDGKNVIIEPGSLLYFPKGVPHGGESFVESEGPAKFLVIYSPPIQQYP